MNLVVLAAPLVSSKGTKNLAKTLGIELDNHNFFKERSYFNNSLSNRDGVYLCGFSRGPMNISETVVNASGVAGQIATLLTSAKFTQTQEREFDSLPIENTINISPSALIIYMRILPFSSFKLAIKGSTARGSFILPSAFATHHWILKSFRTAIKGSVARESPMFPSASITSILIGRGPRG